MKAPTRPAITTAEDSAAAALAKPAAPEDALSRISAQPKAERDAAPAWWLSLKR
jgi:hypothetical protein